MHVDLGGNEFGSVEVMSVPTKVGKERFTWVLAVLLILARLRLEMKPLQKEHEVNDHRKFNTKG